MMDTLNYKRREDLIKGIKLVLERGVEQFSVAKHHHSGLWALSFPPQPEPIDDDNSEAA